MFEISGESESTTITVKDSWDDEEDGTKDNWDDDSVEGDEGVKDNWDDTDEEEEEVDNPSPSSSTATPTTEGPSSVTNLDNEDKGSEALSTGSSEESESSDESDEEGEGDSELTPYDRAAKRIHVRITHFQQLSWQLSCVLVITTIN